MVVLIEKTSGEALLRVRTVESRNGTEAYRRLHNWYGKQTDMGLAELRQRVIRPAQASREEDIAKCIEDWQEAVMELKRVDPDYKKFPDAYQVAALRGMLSGKYGHYIDMKLAVRESGKDELLNEDRIYAALKRTEINNSNAKEVDAMQRGKGSKASLPSAGTGTQQWPWTQACTDEVQEEEWLEYEHWAEDTWGGT